MADESRGGSRMCGGAPMHAPIWFMGWLFTIGYVKLAFWPAVFALVIWPYYLGQYIRLITLR